MSGTKYVCSECGWVSRRKMGNNKPCPKCGGPMYYHEDDRSIVIITIIAMNRPGFTGELLVQMLGCFFSGIQGFIEVLLCFLRRDVSDFAV